MDADSFYDTLLASISMGPARTKQEDPPPPLPPTPPPPPAQPRQIKASFQPHESPPVRRIDYSKVLDRLAKEELQVGPSVESEEIKRKESSTPSTPVGFKQKPAAPVASVGAKQKIATLSTPVGTIQKSAAPSIPVGAKQKSTTPSTPGSALLRGNAPVYVPKASATAPASVLPSPASTPVKNSTTLEAELRARLLASKKRKASAPPPRPPPLAPSKRPPRGSPVFTTIPLATTHSLPEDHVSEPSPFSSFSQSPVNALPLFDTPPAQSHPQGKLALPPKPPQRDGFRLSIKLPFHLSPFSLTTVETEKFPLSTPISAILDLFNRHSAHDHLYFATPSPRPDMSDPHDTPGPKDEVVLGLDTGIAVGQRFYRDPPRNNDRRSGPGWDTNAGNLRATLEDVATVAGAEVVECEIRSDPPPHAHRPATADKNSTGYLEEDGGEKCWAGGEHTAEDGWNVSPVVEQGGWDYHDPAYLQNHHQHHQQQQQWGIPWQAPTYPVVPPPIWIPDPAFLLQQPLSTETEPEAQRWIPGHKDYDNAGWIYGFNGHGQSKEEPTHPHQPPSVHSSRRDSIIEPLAPMTVPGPIPVSQGPRPHNAPDGKKQKKRGSGTTRSGAMKRKKGKDTSTPGKPNRGRGGGGGMVA